jgi:NADPH:quinone reductase
VWRAGVIPVVARGVIRLMIDQTVDFAEFGQAAARLRSGDAVGKIVLTLA